MLTFSEPGRVAAALIGIITAAGLAVAAEQTIQGKAFIVKNPNNDPSKRAIRGSAREKNSPNTLVGDPTVTGGVLELMVDGASSSNQVFNLLQGTSSIGKPFWVATPTGYKYQDRSGDQGPVKSLAIKRSPSSGTFKILTSLKGTIGLITVLPPNPGVSGCMALTLGVGDRYSAAFGPESKITNLSNVLFRARKPTVQSVCPNLGSTTTSTASTTTTTASTTTTTTLYGSPSRAFLSAVPGLLD